ncbi:MAG: TetR/AcrR family transcriptional regulator [Pseudomonadota bacterium]
MSEVSTADRILDAAESRVQTAGYNGFSFRDLAEDVGIKSASVHHHFPTKEALVTRLTDRYTDRFFAGLKDKSDASGRVGAYRAAFRQAFLNDNKMCLCGMLGAESGGLPGAVTAATHQFFDRIVAHLAESLASVSAKPRQRALAIVARLEGAMILARACGTVEVFDEATRGMEDELA